MSARRFELPQGAYLEAETELDVRFQEVDSLRIVWHGHYLTYCEEGRLAFGRAFGIGYEDLAEAGLAVPIVHAQLDYLAPARFGQRLRVRARLYPERAARLSFRYWIEAEGRLLATAFTVQAFTDLEGRLQVVRPPYYDAFLSRWDQELREGEPC
ncbi:MAG: acyl-CoA thioesterase [Planctomycetota bacterium]